jgi:hypothetical protein
MLETTSLAEITPNEMKVTSSNPPPPSCVDMSKKKKKKKPLETTFLSHNTEMVVSTNLGFFILTKD